MDKFNLTFLLWWVLACGRGLAICGESTGGPGDIKDGVDTVEAGLVVVPATQVTGPDSLPGCTGTAVTLYCIVVPEILSQLMLA